jgi:uncharacterized membrane protein YfhO
MPLPPPLELVLDGPVRVYENPNVMPRAFLAREVVAAPDPAERLALLGSPDFDPRVAVLEYEEDVRSPGPARGEVHIESYEPRRVVLRARLETPGLVVLADAWDSGWSARVDGERVPIERVDHSLRGVWLEPGEREIEMVHDPESFRIGLGFALGGLLVSGFLLTRTGRAG